MEQTFTKRTPAVVRFGAVKNTLPYPLCQNHLKKMYKAGVITRGQYRQGKSNLASFLADKEDAERLGQ